MNSCQWNKLVKENSSNRRWQKDWLHQRFRNSTKSKVAIQKTFIFVAAFYSIFIKKHNFYFYSLSLFLVYSVSFVSSTYSKGLYLESAIFLFALYVRVFFTRFCIPFNWLTCCGSFGYRIYSASTSCIVKQTRTNEWACMFGEN